ncbi:hypothetical protein [Desulfovibrio piger]|uniref:hypothetical protein n=1 Tax=Desulfovibrio piger TaxID=901 RepID=UPI0019588513|nr:hypothetical protein [Desulfovibrio piger]MBM6835296.1 hypothetical protein [Desulfovibrio piger]
MLSQDIESCAVSIDVLAGQVTAEHWAYLQLLQRNLLAHAEQARQMENNLLPPTPDTCRVIRRPATNNV